MAGSLRVAPVPGKPALLLGAFDLGGLGYLVEEFFVSGTAHSYVPAAELGADGRWDVIPSDTADYTTRMVVLTPADPARFNGTVLLEWLNVSGGIDAPAVWMMAHREIVRAGYAYVAISAQRVGVEGGPSLLGADLSLKNQDPARYRSLHHPGDAFCYDIFSQAGGLLRDADPHDLLRGLRLQHLVAMGESQSAMFLTTYINAVDPLAEIYDGFLVHSRFASAAPLDGGSVFEESETPQAVTFRPDLRVPLITIITETDLFGGVRRGYVYTRQPDNQWLRVWEIPGAAHADNYTIQVAPIDTGDAPLDAIVAAYAPTDTLMGRQLDYYINFAPQQHYVVQAAVSALSSWVRTGEPAPTRLASRCTTAIWPGPCWIATAWPPTASEPRGWMCRSHGHPATAPRTASWPPSSAPANPSTPPPWTGSIRAERNSISTTSAPRWTGQSKADSSCRPTAARSSNSRPPPSPAPDRSA
ncbi:hypothetical protein BB170200_01917 [Mycobacterium marinum]|nr:hypothetical protein BB170200_01917 [Mycobacterium marinum]